MRRKTHSKGRSSHGGRKDDFCLCEELRCVNVWGESEEWVRLPASVWVLVSFKILLLGLFRDVAGTGDLSCWNRSKQGGMGLFAYCLKKKKKEQNTESVWGWHPWLNLENWSRNLC